MGRQRCTVQLVVRDRTHEDHTQETAGPFNLQQVPASSPHQLKDELLHH